MARLVLYIYYIICIYIYIIYAVYIYIYICTTSNSYRIMQTWEIDHYQSGNLRIINAGSIHQSVSRMIKLISQRPPLYLMTPDTQQTWLVDPTR